MRRLAHHVHGKTIARLHNWCCDNSELYDAWHEHIYHSHTHWLFLFIFLIGWVTGLFSQFGILRFYAARAASFSFAQSSWATGATANNANHTSNRTGWTEFSAKDANLTAGATLTLTSVTGSSTQTSDTDFNAGTHASTVVSATGADATVGLTRGGSSYFAVAHTTSPFITIYSRSGSTFTKLANPATLPAGNGSDATLSADGNYLAVAHSNSPFVTIYSRSGDTFTKLNDPDVLPAATGNVAFSSDGTYLAVTQSSSPYLIIYKRSGSTFTKLNDPATLPPNTANDVSFSTDNTYLAVSHIDSQYVTIYKRSGDTFTKLTLSEGLTGNTIGRGVAFSPDGTYLAVAGDASPYITLYSRSGDTFTKLSNPSSLPTTAGDGVAFSANGDYLALTHGNSPFLTLYSRSGSTFTKLSNPSTMPPNSAEGVDFSPDGTYLAVAHNTSPFVTIYSRSGDTFTKLSNPATLPAGRGYGATFSDPYASSGTFTSSVIDTAQVSTFTTLDFTATTPASTTLTIDVRAGNVATPDGTWTAWQTSIANGGSIAALNGNRYVQYRANLSTTDTTVTPSLAVLTANFSYYSASQTLTSSPFNTETSTTQLTQIAWGEVDPVPAGTDVQFQIRTAPDASGAPGTWSNWLGPTSTSDYYKTTPAGETINSTHTDGSNDQWVQYRLLLTSTGLNTQTLSSATISYSTFPGNPSITSSSHTSETTYYPSRTPSITVSAGTPAPTHYHYIVTQTASPPITAVDDGPEVAGSFTVSAAPGENTITSDGTWYVHVVAQDGSHVNSASYATVTTKIDSTAPTSTTLSFGSIAGTSIAVSASASDATAGLHATPFYFERDSGVANSGWISGNWSDTGLAVNTQYNYRVKARDAAATPNESSFTANTAKYTAANTPGTPSVTSPTTSSVKVTIDRNSNPTGTAPAGDTQYVIAASTDNFASNTSYVQPAGGLGGTEQWQTYSQWGGASGFTVSSLSSNATYTFKVKARNGDSTETSYGSSASGFTASGAPVNFRATSIGTTSVTIAVDTFSGDNVGQAGYYFSRAGLNSGWIQTNSWTDTGVITPNTTYTYSAKTRNSSAQESVTSALTVTTLAETPATPTIDTSTRTQDTLYLTFAASNNPTTTQYAIQETTQNQYVQASGALGTEEVWRTVAQWAVGSTVAITSLIENTTYTFRIKARNSANGETAFSTSVSGTTLATNAPNTPTFDSAQATQNALVILLSATGNAATTQYAIQETAQTGNQYVQTNGALGNIAAWQTLSVWMTNSGGFTVTGLTENKTYTFRVKAKGASGTETAFSTAASATTLAQGVPRAPTLPESGKTVSSLVVVLDNTGFGATAQFAIQETTQNKYVQTNGSLGTDAAWQTYTAWGGAAGKTVTDLVQGTAYTFRVKSRDSANNNVESAFGPGTSASTRSGSGSSDTTPPSLPSSITPSVIDAVLRLTWRDPPERDFFRVIVYRSATNAPPGGNPYAVVLRGNENFRDVDVRAGQTYQYILRFEDQSGNGVLSDVIRLTIPGARPISEIGGGSSVNLKELIRIQNPSAPLLTIERVSGLEFLLDQLVPSPERQETFRTRLRTVRTARGATAQIIGRFGLLYDVIPRGAVAGVALSPSVSITVRYNTRDAALILRGAQLQLALAYYNGSTKEWELVDGARQDAAVGTFVARVNRAGTYGIVILMETTP